MRKRVLCFSFFIVVVHVAFKFTFVLGSIPFGAMIIRPRGYKLFSCSTQLSMKFILLINVKMPTVVGILIFISMINTTSEHLKARKDFIF